MSDINQPCLSTPFFWYIYFFFLFRSHVYFCLYGPFNCISFHKFSWQLSIFSLCSSGLISALLVLSTIFLFMKVSFSPDIIRSDWLGSKHQLKKQQILRQARVHRKQVILNRRSSARKNDVSRLRVPIGLPRSVTQSSAIFELQRIIWTGRNYESYCFKN